MLEALGNLGDFIGGIAVIATLIYLAVQIRQNTNALRTASRQQIAEGFRDHNRLWLQPGAAASFVRGMQAYPDMTFEERNSFSTQLNDHALFFQGAFALHESGVLDDATFVAYLDYFSAWVATPGGTSWWQEVSPLYAPGMVAAVEARVLRGGLPDLIGSQVFGNPDDDRQHEATAAR